MHLENSIHINNSVINVLDNYAAWRLDFNIAGIVFINVSTSSSSYSADSSTVSERIVRNIWSSIWNTCIHVMPDISSEKYKKSSLRERLSLDSQLSKDNDMYRVKTTVVWASTRLKISDPASSLVLPYFKISISSDWKFLLV